MLYVASILKGGLGNYLFQIAAGYAQALKHNKQYACVLKDVQVGHTPVKDYYSNILRNIIFLPGLKQYTIYQEPSYNFVAIPDFNYNVKLCGYFQSEKYFFNFKKQIKELFKIDNKTRAHLTDKYKLSTNTCSIHIRRGDYLKLQHVHPVIDIEYYKTAVDIIGKDKQYFVFSDDINWARNNLGFITNPTFISDNKDYEDMYLMSMCYDNIIANSSFSWWGAWLNENESKTVIAPKNWFHPNYLTEFQDIYCPGWKILNNSLN
jgi:hypothetical protein